MPLAFEEDSPFLGNIEPNESHNPNPDNTEDVEKPRIKYLIRQVQKVFISGQLEPQKIIPKPSEQVTKTQENFYLLAASSRVDRAPHKYLHREKLKTIIRQVASEERDGSYIKWYPKEYPTIDTERQFSPEELSKLFNCEDVCLQEACNAYEYKLRELETFVKTVIEKDKSYGGYMEVSYKLVEPSGIGEGFAYKRVFNQATSKTTSKNERLQGTDGDLRSLTKKKQLFLLSKLGVDPEQCKTLKRWDLINLIRHLCNKAAMKGQANALQKFVRMDGVFGAALNL
eukprot:gene16812-22296_t